MINDYGKINLNFLKGRYYILKKRRKATILIGVGLVFLSIFLHYIHYLIFQDVHHTLVYLVGDIAFIPLEIFFTTVVIDNLLDKRQKQHLLQKLNMLIGIFYTEVGVKLLQEITKGDDNLKFLRDKSTIKMIAEGIEDDRLKKIVYNHSYKIDINKVNLENLKRPMDDNRELLITLITNENLLEHEKFTELLMSIVHLREELSSRFTNEVAEYEIDHIKSDLEAVYRYLTIEWIWYMKYLRLNYPRLFTKALINNPFDNRSKKEKDSIYLKLQLS
jgi:hypothetical protein